MLQSTKRAIRAATAVAGLGLALALIAPSATFARGGGGGKQVAGTCSAHSTSTLKVKREDGPKLEVEFEVDQNKVGAAWDVRLRNDGISFWHGQKVTRAPSGSFTVHKLSTDGAGTDTIAARATNLATGETCTASLSI